jgi:hypothetical protein
MILPTNSDHFEAARGCPFWEERWPSFLPRLPPNPVTAKANKFIHLNLIQLFSSQKTQKNPKTHRFFLAFKIRPLECRFLIYFKN